jgi:porin
MTSPAGRSGIVAASAVLLWWIVLGGAAFGQGYGTAPEDSTSLDRPFRPNVSSNFDPGQETPGPPTTPAPGPDPYPDGPKTSKFLFGEAVGLRPALEERGVSFYTSFTQFEQGVASGGFRQAFRWGGKFDMLAHIDSGKFGLWEGGMFDLFAESRLGQSIEGFAGTYSPTNLAMFFPVPDDQITAITGLKFTQALTDRTGFFFGKLNALNGDRERFLKYPLTSRFWNAAFNFNLVLDRYPYSTPGAGFYTSLDRGPSWAFLVLDSHDAPRTSGFENLGRNGVFLYTEAKQATNFFGLPGKQTFGALFGTGAFSNLAPASFIVLPSGEAVAPKKNGTWALLWSIEQRLWVNPDDPDRGLGLYIQTGLGDGNPNPVRGFVSVALCGNSPLPGREGDLLGVGFYDLELSSQFKSQLEGLRDERGVELFYNMRVAPRCHLTPDLQVLHPGLGTVETAVVFGVRMKIDF